MPDETTASMEIEWDVPIEMDDGIVLRSRCVPSIGRRPSLGDPHLRALRQGPGVSRGISRPVAEDGRAAPRRRRRVDQCVPELGGRGPREMGPRGLRVRQGRFPGRRQVAGVHRPLLAPRDRRPGDVYRLGGGAAVVHRERSGLNGISYYGINQWHVASLPPPGLAAMCVWEGAADWYRDMTHHGGIVSTFWANWYDMQVKTVQHGLGDRGPRHPVTGVNVCGDATMTDEELAANRADFGGGGRAHPLDDSYHRDRSARFERIVTPLLSAGNWGGLVFTSEATLRASPGPPPTRSGSRCTGSSTGPTSTPTTAAASNSSSSITSSREPTTGGMKGRRFCSRCGGSTTSSSERRRAGPSQGRFGPGITSGRTGRCRPTLGRG